MPNRIENEIGVAGHTYNVEIGENGKIVAIQCIGRWTMQPVEYIGLDSWTLEQLQAKVDALAVGRVALGVPFENVEKQEQTDNTSKQVQSEIADCLKYVSDLPAYEIAKRISLSESRVQLNLDAMVASGELTVNSVVLASGETMAYYSLADSSKQQQTPPEASKQEMTEWQLTKLQQVLTDATKANAIPLELSYIFSAALCELCDAIKRSPERIRKEYGNRLYAQLEQYVQK